MQKKVAGMIIAPLWNAFMLKVLPNIPDERFTPPDAPANYSALKPIIRGVWRTGDNSTIHNILQTVNKNDPLGVNPLFPQNDPQYDLWEKPVQDWLATHAAEISTMPGSSDTLVSTSLQQTLNTTPSPATPGTSQAVTQ